MLVVLVEVRFLNFLGLATGFCVLYNYWAKYFLCTHVLLAGVCFGTIFKPPLSGYDVCAAMCLRCLATSRESLLSELKFVLIRPLCSKSNSKENLFKSPNIFQNFYVVITRVSPVYLLSRNAGSY